MQFSAITKLLIATDRRRAKASGSAIEALPWIRAKCLVHLWRRFQSQLKH
jgi:hypothetical protein